LIIAFGTKYYGTAPYEVSSTYLRAYEQVIQGILEYWTTYIRLIYSTVSNPPPSCVRELTGSVNYEAFGWFVTGSNIGFLIPWTLINAASLAALLLAVTLPKGGYLPPFHPRKVIYDPHFDEEEVPDEWRDKVGHNLPTSTLKEVLNGGGGYPRGPEVQ